MLYVWNTYLQLPQKWPFDVGNSFSTMVRIWVWNTHEYPRWFIMVYFMGNPILFHCTGWLKSGFPIGLLKSPIYEAY